MILRSRYIEAIKPFINKPQIKILTGIRRSGKSTVLNLLKAALVESGVKPDQVITINFESFAYSELLQAKTLYQHVKDEIKSVDKHYLLLDETQEVEDWEKAVNSFLVHFNVDIYLTGSNSHLLSSELATYLAGRYIEIPVYTLSYKEFLDFRNHYFSKDLNEINLFLHYLRKGGFPVIHTADYTEESAYKIVYDIYSSVILRDTVQRYKI